MEFNKILALIVIYVFNGLQAAFKIPNYGTGPFQYVELPFELDEAIDWEANAPNFASYVWTADDELYFFSDEGIMKYNVGIDNFSTVLSSRYLNMEGYKYIKSFSFSFDHNKILLRYDYIKNRYPDLSVYDIIDLKNRRTSLTHNGSRLQYCAWSPTSYRVVYVYNSNIYIYLEKVIFQLTKDGGDGVIYYGIPDEVYRQQIFNGDPALWWSPDGRFLAFAVFNNSNVDTVKHIVYGEAENPEFRYPKVVDVRYPKPGTNNTVVTLKVYDLETNETYSAIQAPIERVSNENILKSVAWTRDNKLLITWLNRLQNIASLQWCTISGECREVKRIEEPTGWIDISTPYCLKSTQNCLFIYWIGKWRQVWNLNLETGENIWPARSNFTVLKLYGYDEINDKLYFQATLTDDTSMHHVYNNGYCVTCTMGDKGDGVCYSADASFSVNYSYYIALCNGPKPSYSKLMRTRDRKKLRNWDKNGHYNNMLKGKMLPAFSTKTIYLADGSDGTIQLTLPPQLDGARKYPMIVYVNGSPGSVIATNEFSVGFQTFMTTNREVVYAQIDGRGTGNKGKDSLFSVINHLGEFEVEDIIFITKYLLETMPYVDKDRCGIWGWHYGGYLTARTLANDSEKLFQCGISVNPITSWLYADSLYTERLMGMPFDNWGKYFNSSVLQNIENFRKHDFMLVYGTGDELVHHQHSAMLAKILQANDILFEELIYPDVYFAKGEFALHMYHSMNRFWSNCFSLDFNEDDF